MFSTPPEKAEKENNIWGKDKFVLFPYTELKIHSNFATTISNRLRDPLIKIFAIKIRDLENVDQGHDVQHSQFRHSMANI